jgi:dTDP-4-amino-4,6-dideoxygalactose transaminase
VTGRDFDRLVNTSVRAFKPGRLLPQLEVQPSAPLLAAMAHRLGSFDGSRLRRRAASGAWLAAHLPPGVVQPGGQMPAHTYWLFPVLAPSPDDLIAACRLAGFDAARGASSVAPVPQPAGRPEAEPRRAKEMMRSLVFLPAYPELSPASLARLAQALDVRPDVARPQTTRGRLRRA